MFTKKAIKKAMKPFEDDSETILKPTNCRKAKAITVRPSG